MNDDKNSTNKTRPYITVLEALPKKVEPKEETITEKRLTISPLKSELSETSPNSRRYKQCYRFEWESMPDFKGWLKGVPGQATRAYCTVCSKTLHAHRLSLLKHMCTLKHTKAAQVAFAMQNAKKETRVENPSFAPSMAKKSENITVTENQMTVVESRLEEEEVDDADLVVDGEEQIAEDDAMPPSSKVAKVDMASTQTPPSPLSTHVLDTAKGNPIGGMQVSLYRLIDGRWTHLNDGYTDPDGRCTNLIKKVDFIAGRYKLHFDVDRYFELRRQESLYPFIEIVFDVKSPQEHYHVPLLLSPFGYTTYRGS